MPAQGAGLAGLAFEVPDIEAADARAHLLGARRVERSRRSDEQDLRGVFAPDEEIAAIKALGCNGAIVGRALYEDRFTLPEAIATALRDALARRPALEAASAALKVRRQAAWRAPAEKVARMLAAARR